MKRTIWVGIAAVLMALAMIVTAQSQEEMVVVENDVFDNPQRPPSVFRHEEHNEAAEIYECNACHHVYDDEGNLLPDESSEDERCADCHTLEDEGRRPGLMKAFHTNCKGCHLEREKGPITCGECHVRGFAADGES
jgi:hypothetical protein